MIIGIEREDGGLSVMNLAEGLTLADVPGEIAKWESGGLYKAVRWEEITQHPPRLYRNAYELGARNNAVVNMVKARDAHRDILRAERAPRLEALDVEYTRADEAEDITLKRQIAAEKEVYRNVTVDPRIEAAATTDELQTLTLDTLVTTPAP